MGKPTVYASRTPFMLTDPVAWIETTGPNLYFLNRFSLRELHPRRVAVKHNFGGLNLMPALAHNRLTRTRVSLASGEKAA
jgi:hypothetical protein